MATNPFGSHGSNFMAGFTGQLTQAMNQVFQKEYAEQQNTTQQNQALVGALIKGGSPEVQALGLTLLQNPKALKDASKLFQTPEYQQILEITRKAHQQAGGGAGAAGPGAPGSGPQILGAPPPGGGGADAGGAAGGDATSAAGGLTSAPSMTSLDGMSPMALLGGASADSGSTSAQAQPQAPAAPAVPSAAMPSTSPVTGGSIDLAPAAGAGAAAPPASPIAAASAGAGASVALPTASPIAAASPSPTPGTALGGAPSPVPTAGVGAPPPAAGPTNRVQSYADFKTFTAGAANSVYAQARAMEDKIAQDVAQRNPLNYQSAIEKAVEPVRHWEQAKFEVLAKMGALGESLEAQGVPFAEASKMMQQQLAPLQAKADAALDLEGAKQKGREHLEGVTKPQAKIEVQGGTRAALQTQKHQFTLQEIDERGRLAAARAATSAGKPIHQIETDPQGNKVLKVYQIDPKAPGGLKEIGSHDSGHVPLASAEKQVLEGTINAQKFASRLLGLKEQIDAAGGDVSWPEAKLNKWMYDKGMDPGKLQAAKLQLAGAYNANMLSALGRGTRLHMVAEQFLSHLPQQGDEGVQFWQKVSGMVPIISDTQDTIFQVTGTKGSDFGLGTPPPGASAAPAAAATPTATGANGEKYILQNGAWVQQ